MAKSQAAELTPLDPQTIEQPFDLATAIGYMREHGEVIRGHHGGQAFYMTLDVQRRPVIVNGRRVFKNIETVTGVYQWGSQVTTIPLSDLFTQSFTIMSFDEDGNPLWVEPASTELGEEVMR